MKPRNMFWIFLAAGLLLVCFVPVARFIFVNLKAGYDEGERQAATRPAVTAAAPSASDAGPSPKPPAPAAVDFGKLDFSSNSTDVSNRGDHFVDKLPPLHGSARNGYDDGFVGQGNFELRGGVGLMSGASRLRLPSATHSGGLVSVEVVVEQGTVRAYLSGLKGHVISGYVYADASPGRPARVSGYLEDWSGSGTPEQCFVIETRDGDARGVSYRVYRSR